jgi:hypothetical protein
MLLAMIATEIDYDCSSGGSVDCTNRNRSLNSSSHKPDVELTIEESLWIRSRRYECCCITGW